LEMQVSTSREALEDFERGAIDAAIVLRHDNRRRDGETILEEAFAWMAAPDFEHRTGEALRLATQAEPCSVRNLAIDALKTAGISWTEVFVGGGVTTTGAAVSAGLAVAALGRRVAPLDVIDVGAKFGLPPLPSRDVVLHSSVSDRATKNSLKALAATIRATANRSAS
jgi:DNA-binding transcriptional LysR family regulator